MRPLPRGTDGSLLEKTRQGTLWSGRLYSAITLVFVGGFSVLALDGPLGARYLAWCLAGYIPSFLFLTFGREVLASRPSFIVAFHALSLFGLQVMGVGFLSLALLGPNPNVEVSTAIVGFVAVSALLVSVFAAGARPYLWAILVTPPLVLSLVLLFAGRLTYLTILRLSTVWATTIACLVLSFVYERGTRSEPVGDFGTLKERNRELERNMARLEKEIEERKATEGVLEQRASIDELTGVYNRRAGLEILKQSIHLTERQSQPLVVCFIDIDDLKTVNDNWGHSAGDELIRAVIRVLKKHLRRSDYISRFGGDEFLANLTNCTADAARVILDRIRADLEEESGKEQHFPIAISYGLAERVPSSDLSAEELLRLADTNMYLHKQQKKVKSPS